MTPEQKLELIRITKVRRTIAIALTSVMCVAYFGFILLVAFDKELMGSLVADGQISVGIIMGALVILCAPLLTGIYVRWANRRYDGVVASLLGEEGKR